MPEKYTKTTEVEAIKLTSPLDFERVMKMVGGLEVRWVKSQIEGLHDSITFPVKDCGAYYMGWGDYMVRYPGSTDCYVEKEEEFEEQWTRVDMNPDKDPY